MVAGNVIAVCAAALLATTMLGKQAYQSARTNRSDSQDTKVHSVTTPPIAGTGRNGALIGAAPDQRVRSFLKENGLPE